MSKTGFTGNLAEKKMNFHPYIFQGYTDSVTTCDCCGRSELKVTVALWAAEDGEEIYMGTSCAARALGMTAKEVKHRSNAADRERIEAESAERNRKHDIWLAAWLAYLVRHTGGIYHCGELSISKMGASLPGGISATIKRFNAEFSAI